MEAFVCEVVASSGLFDGELIHDDEEMDLNKKKKTEKLLLRFSEHFSTSKKFPRSSSCLQTWVDPNPGNYDCRRYLVRISYS